MAPPLATPLAPPSLKADVPVKNCKSALLYSAKAPRDPAPGAGDLASIWAHVPVDPTIASNPPKKMPVLIFYHGNDNYVTVNANGASLKADWYKGATVVCAPVRYGLAAAADAQKQPIVLVPGVGIHVVRAIPQKDASGNVVIDPATSKPVTVPTPGSDVVEGRLGPPAALGQMVDDCFDHLSKLLKADPPCGAGIRCLSSKPNLDKIDRLILLGHSGGAAPLRPSALSDLAKSRPTDLVHLDCTYVDDVGGKGFITTKRSSLGNAAGQSRMICVNIASTGTDKGANALFDSLKSKTGPMKKPDGSDPIILRIGPGVAKSNDSKTPTNLTRPIDPVSDWPAASAVDVVQLSQKSGDLSHVKEAMKKYPVLFVKTTVGHDDIPKSFVPLVLETAVV